MSAPAFALSERDFDWLRRAAQSHSGIVLPEAKRAMVYSRLCRRLRALGLHDFAGYRRLVEDRASGEFAEFINSLTTNLTAFFREPHHFEHLARLANGARHKRLRIWSAGSSTGEEPYSIMIAVREASARDPSLLATDLDTRVLAHASAGIYRAESLAGVDPARCRRWFLRGRGAHAGQVRVKPELQAGIEFRELNLVKPWRMPEPFDAIFCRNVVIYFDTPTRRDLFSRMYDALAPGGYLYLGHSETLFEISDRFELVGKTIYRRP